MSMPMMNRRALLAGAAALAAVPALPSLAQVPLPGPLDLTAAAKPKDKGDVAALAEFFEQVFEQQAALSPEFQTQLGLRTNYDKWDDRSPAFRDARLARTKDALARLRAGWDPARLPEAHRVNFRIFEAQAEREVEEGRWRDHEYALSHLYGRHTGVPSFLINQHRVDTPDDARAYVARLEGVPLVLGQAVEQAQRSAAKGIVPPRFSLEKMLPDARAVVTGAPFDNGPDSSLWADIKKKVGALPADEAQKQALLKQAESALTGKVKPAYDQLISAMEALAAKATDDDGVWKLPDGEAYYRFTVREATTVDMAPEEVHQVGLQELRKLQDEMRGVMKAVGFKGELKEFFNYLRTDDRFYYPNDDAGRAAYLKQCEQVLADFRPKLDEMFITKPKAELVVKRVEPFREKSAPPAFYNRPALDGSRPGIFYANLANMREMAKWQVDAIVYHEGLPGHHMQIAIAQELQDVPTFRKFVGFGAYSEGWGLYSERLPKEIGFYKDPYSDFGRLSLQAWRAVRLVVDSGIHAKKWTREQAIQFFVDNTPLSREQCTREIDRYIVNPGQATSYFIGLLKILELRDKARQALGPKFDLRGFHDAVLRSGAVPLPVLGEQVEGWVRSVKA
ncbi:DUF885 domain-containing protein [Aerophototrophica crusticola]|uniref:DUF885 domain-containing protein n=1 Tax=Aerophototrophica crusticola TaxID=1709002 RepID=A0A858R2Y4_9PROT|nr:DUF885 domain-containing protein [Rhodospirillaceae bacterium B3]